MYAPIILVVRSRAKAVVRTRAYILCVCSLCAARPRIIGALARLYCSVVRLRACISYICGALARPVRLRARHVVWCAYALVILLSAFARLAGTLVRLPSVARARARQWMRAVA